MFGIERGFRMDMGTYGKSVINTLKTDYQSMQDLFRSLQCTGHLMR